MTSVSFRHPLNRNLYINQQTVTLAKQGIFERENWVAGQIHHLSKVAFFKFAHAGWYLSSMNETPIYLKAGHHKRTNRFPGGGWIIEYSVSA